MYLGISISATHTKKEKGGVPLNVRRDCSASVLGGASGADALFQGRHETGLPEKGSIIIRFS